MASPLEHERVSDRRREHGSVVLARAGLLDGYRSTIHWEPMADFMEEFPRLEISPNLFVIDRDRFTCGGGTAGLDMMLALIGRQHGQPLAVAVAEQFLHTRIRQPTESQRMNILARYHITDGRLATAIAVMEQHVERPLPTEAVALRCGVSPRQLERLFLAALNNTPGDCPGSPASGGAAPFDRDQSIHPADRTALRFREPRSFREMLPRSLQGHARPLPLAPTRPPGGV